MRLYSAFIRFFPEWKDSPGPVCFGLVNSLPDRLLLQHSGRPGAQTVVRSSTPESLFSSGEARPFPDCPLSSGCPLFSWLSALFHPLVFRCPPVFVMTYFISSRMNKAKKKNSQATAVLQDS